jgi:hemoglobin-like flavoprotein
VISQIRLAQHGGYIFIVRTAMTPTQVSLVQDSFRKVVPQFSEASRVFYEELFRLAPDMRAMFPSDLQAQKQKLTQMLDVVIRSLDRIGTVSDDIVDLGYRHVAYDVEEENYAAFGEALLRMLEKLLGPDLTPEMREAWAAAYDMLARVMQECATTARSTEGFYSRIIRDVMVAQYGVALRNERGGGRASISQEIDGGKVIRLS